MNLTPGTPDFGHPFRPDPNDDYDWLIAGVLLMVLYIGLLLLRWSLA